jgi:hypothetical protein
MAFQCPACNKQFTSSKALSGHQARCKSMGGAVAETARRYVEFDGNTGPRKRRRTSFSTTVEDEEEQDDPEAIDAEVSCDISTHLLVSEDLQTITGRRTSPTLSLL